MRRADDTLRSEEAAAAEESAAAAEEDEGQGCKAAKQPSKQPPKPQPELEVETLALPSAKHLAFDVGLCVVTKGGALQCLDARDNCKVDSPWPGLSNVDTVSGSCARSRDGAREVLVRRP